MGFVNRVFEPPQIRRYRLILNYIVGTRVLDLGSYEGGLHNYLKSSLKNDIIGVDKKKNKNIDLLCDLGKGLPFKTNCIDTIVAGEILEHLENPYGFLNECYRVISNGGKIIITTPNMTGLQHILASRSRSDKRGGHLFAWNEEMLDTALRRSRFKVLMTTKITAYWYRNVFLRMLCFLIPPIRTTLVAVGQKV